jgi:hypothetical protein
MIVTGQGCPGKSRLARLLSVVAGEPVVTVRMSDGLVHAAVRGELWCTGVAAPTVGPSDSVITCLHCLVDVAPVEAMRLLADAHKPFGAAAIASASAPIPATAVVLTEQVADVASPAIATECNINARSTS